MELKPGDYILSIDNELDEEDEEYDFMDWIFGGFLNNDTISIILSNATGKVPYYFFVEEGSIISLPESDIDFEGNMISSSQYFVEEIDRKNNVIVLEED